MDIMKILVALLFLANVGFVGFNAWSTIERPSIEEYESSVERKMLSIKKGMERYRYDISRVRDQNITKVEHENAYFAQQARRPEVGIDPIRDLSIDNRSQKGSLGKTFGEEKWKIKFKSKRPVEWSRIARYCELIESESPQFQIKEIDLGNRLEAWGAEQWQAQYILVRRVFRKSKAGRT